ncbi:MAG: hypothetical protein O6848_03770 [Bacteroidetes bacterium]|nr:hypothetical protein [Bacteroidota bacterium]
MKGKSKVILSGIIFYMDLEGQKLLDHFMNNYQLSNTSDMNSMEAQVTMENEAATYFLEALNLGKSYVSLADVKMLMAKFEYFPIERKVEIPYGENNLVKLLSIFSVLLNQIEL